MRIPSGCLADQSGIFAAGSRTNSRGSVEVQLAGPHVCGVARTCPAKETRHWAPTPAKTPSSTRRSCGCCWATKFRPNMFYERGPAGWSGCAELESIARSVRHIDTLAHTGRTLLFQCLQSWPVFRGSMLQLTDDGLVTPTCIKDVGVFAIAAGSVFPGKTLFLRPHDP